MSPPVPRCAGASAVNFAPVPLPPYDEGDLRALADSLQTLLGRGKPPFDLGQIAALQLSFALALFGDGGLGGACAKSQAAALYPKETAVVGARRPFAACRTTLRSDSSAEVNLPPQAVRETAGKLRLKSGKNWFCFVIRPYSKHVSISSVALILQRCHLAVLQKLHLLAIIRSKITKTPWLILTGCISDFGGAASLPPSEAREHMLMQISLESLVRRSRETSATRGKLAPNSRGREQDFLRGVLALNRLSMC